MPRPGEAQPSAIAVTERPDAATNLQRLMTGMRGVAGRAALLLATLAPASQLRADETQVTRADQMGGNATKPSAVRLDQGVPPEHPDLRACREKIAYACAEWRALLWRRCDAIQTELQSRVLLRRENEDSWESALPDFQNEWKNWSQSIEAHANRNEWNHVAIYLVGFQDFTMYQERKFQQQSEVPDAALLQKKLNELLIEERRLKQVSSVPDREAIASTDPVLPPRADRSKKGFAGALPEIFPISKRSWEEQNIRYTETSRGIHIESLLKENLLDHTTSEERFAYRINGNLRVRSSHAWNVEKKQWEQMEKITYWQNNKPQSHAHTASDTYRYWSPEGRLSALKEHASSDMQQKVWVYGADGDAVSDFKTEQKRRKGKFTTDDYIQLLADRTKNEWDLNVLFKSLMNYDYDFINNDTWQTPEQTIARTYNGTMRGDCEDFSFLARAILRKQGKNAHVITIQVTAGAHAICVWTERNGKGFIGKSLCNMGLNNGGLFVDVNAPQIIQGKAKKTVKEALEEVIGCYMRMGTDLPNHVVIPETGLTILTIDGGNQKYTATPLTAFEPPRKEKSPMIARGR